jgi:hypothetical protein
MDYPFPGRFRVMRAFGFIVLLLVLTCAFARVTSAQSDWALAMQSNEAILATLEGKTADSAPGAADAEAVILLERTGFDVLPGSHKHYRNVVFVVNVPEEIGDDLLAPYLGARETVDEAAAFVVRGGTVERLAKDHVQIEPGDGQVLRNRLRLTPSGLQPGDVIGWSTISTVDRVLYNATIPAASRVPVVTRSLLLLDHGLHTYRIVGHAMPGLDVQVMAEEHGRPSAWQAQAKNIAAMPRLQADGPFAVETPLFLVTESEEYGVLGSDDWIPTLAWSRVALWLSGLREAAIGKMVDAYGKAPQITQGHASAVDKEAAIFEYVRDDLASLEGDAYDRLGARLAKEIFASGKATEMEKTMLMVTLLEASGLGGEIAAVRPESWGPFDDGLQSFVEFQHVAVRCGDEAPRFYAPQIHDSSPGRLPAAWGNASVVSPRPGLTQKAYEISSQIPGEELADIRSLFVKVQAQALKEGWVRIEHAR